MKEIEALPDLDSGQLELYKKANRVKDSLALHSASMLGVPVLLVSINWLTGFDVPWSLIPICALLFSWISHLFAYRLTKPKIERAFLGSVGYDGSWSSFFKSGRKSASAMGKYAGLFREAAATKDAIIAQIKADGKKSPIEKEIIPSLDQYVGQVRLLAQTVNEIDAIIGSIPMQDLSKDKAELYAKAADPANDAIKGEYLKSVGEIEKQETAFKDLRNQREVLELRLKSSVNSIKQIQLDVARLRSSPETAESAALEDMRRRTDELTHYLEDLRKGYDESRRDPFAELEEAARRQEEAKRLDSPGGDQA